MKQFLLICLLWCQCIAVIGDQTSETCVNLEKAFLSTASDNEEPACRCMPKDFGKDDENEEFVFVGCTRQDLPSVFRALHAVNETNITQLTIWDSVIDPLPSNMFAMVQPKILSIQGSALSSFRKDPFSNLSARLKSLFLRNNKIKKVNEQVFTKLNRLELLDLSSNKLATIQKKTFSQLANLQILMLSNNRIDNIEEGAFENLTNLRTLNLGENKLQAITKNTFRGLRNLEVLELEGNQIEKIDWQAFQNMPKLRLLNLGHNKLSGLELRNLVSLENLLINNNAISSLKQVVLRNLPKVSNLRLDRNHIVEIKNGDMNGLRDSTQLRSFSLVANNLTKIDAYAFEHLTQLTTLSLQNNAITSMRSLDGTRQVFWLAPMQKLKRLFLSQNNISSLEAGDISIVPTLQEVSLDNNQMSSIDKNALKGLQLRKLFLNNNSFHYLPEGIFDGWDTELIFSVDLAENPWECICGYDKWVGVWLSNLGDRSTPSGNIGCVAYQQQGCDHSDDSPKHSAWITVFAGVLSFIALLFLTAIAYLYIQEACARSPLPLRRIPSDMMRLIPSVESLSFPNPMVAEANKVNMDQKSDDNGTTVKVTNGANRSNSLDDQNKTDKKRVRFDGV